MNGGGGWLTRLAAEFSAVTEDEAVTPREKLKSKWTALEAIIRTERW